MSPFDHQLMYSGRTRRRRWLMPLMLIVLLVAVAAAAMQVFPRDGMSKALSSRHARKLLVDAKRWEAESLYISAAEIYERIAQNTGVAQALRRDAAVHLADLYSGPLNDPQRATAALEKVYYLTPNGPQRDDLRARLGRQRGMPVVRSAPTPAAAAQDKSAGALGKSSGLASAASALPAIEGKPLARLGQETVTIEEVLYAWSIYHGNAPAEGPEFERFVHWYLDMVLLADAAGRRGLLQDPGVALELRFRGLMSLYQAEVRQMINSLDDPSSASLQAFYEQTRDRWQTPARATIGHIVVKERRLASEIASEIREGASFAELAREHSLDAKSLPKGYELGVVFAGPDPIPQIGNIPGLAERLLAQRDGYTTGPLQSERGYHIVRVLEKTAARAASLDEVRDQVVEAYQRIALATRQQEEVKRLRAELPIEFVNGNVAPPEAPAAPEASAEAVPTSGSLPAGPLPPDPLPSSTSTPEQP